MRPPLTLAIAATVLSAGTSRAQVSFSDGDFGSWSTTLLVSVNGSTGFGTQVTSGGNPGNAWQVLHQVTNLGSTGILHEPTSPAASFDPVTQGPFSGVQVSLESNVLQASSFGGVVAFTVMAEQGGTRYWLNCSYTLVFQSGGWQPVTATASAGGFVPVGGSGPPLDLESGAPVTFGFYTGNSTAGGGGVAEALVDNFSVTLQVGSLLGAQSCTPPGSNSAGGYPAIVATGSALAGGNPLNLAVTCLPPNQFGYFLASQAPGLVVGPGGSQGTLCLGGAIGRFTAQIQNSGASGAFDIDVDTNLMPQPTGPVAVQAGETWHFQAWYRDNNPGATSNFSAVASVTFL